VCQTCRTALMNVEQPTMKAHRPNRAKLQRAIKKRDKLRSNWCRRCRFRAPSGRCLDTTIRNGRCGDWVYYLLRGNKQYRRRWVRPKDPRTPAQLHSRARLGAASHTYSARLTDEQRDACIAAGAKLQSRRRLGQSGSLTGQQYSVRKAYVKNAAAKAQNARIAAKVRQLQEVTRPTWGPHRGISRVSPGRRGSRRRAAVRGQEAVAHSEVQQSQMVTRSARARYRGGSGVASVPRRRGTGPARTLRARLMQKRGVRLMPARRPAARPYAAPARAPGARFGGGN
jgi:hypothetical protein